MSDIGSDKSTRPRRWLEPRFSLLSLLIVMSLVCVTLGYFFRTRYCTVEAMYRVGARQEVLMGDNANQFDAREFEITQSTQIGLIKSEHVLTAAIRDPKIARLAILANKSDPVGWLVEQVEADFLNHDEILVVRMRGPKSTASDLVSLVNAIAKAYESQVLYSDQVRLQVQHDALARQTLELGDRVKRKMSAVETMTTQLGNDSVDVKAAQIELDEMTEQWRQMQRTLETGKTNMNGPQRIQKLQPAIVHDE